MNVSFLLPVFNTDKTLLRICINSILHALGAGYGSAVSISLSTRVQLRDTPVKREPDDPHGLILAVVETWSGAGLTMPDAEELH